MDDDAVDVDADADAVVVGAAVERLVGSPAVARWPAG